MQLRNAVARRFKRDKGEWVSWLSNLFRVGFPYLVIYLATVMIFYLWFSHDGIASGHDVSSHLALIGDLVYGFNHGYGFSSTSHLIFGNFAYNPYLFYGHLPHIICAILVYMFSGVGMSVTLSIKVVSFLSVFISGLFVYWLSMRISKGGRGLSLGIAILYTLLPYRIWCFMYRFAFSEAFSLMFLPIFFYGLYRILNDEEAKVTPYLCVALSFPLLFMSHPFTALITGVAGVFYFLFFADKLFKLIRRPRKLIYTGVSLFICLGMCLYFLLPMMEALDSGLYRVSDSEAMWTTREGVISFLRLTSEYAGFISFDWIAEYGVGYADSVSGWIAGLILLPTLLLASLGVDLLLEWKLGDLLKNKPYIRLLVMAAIIFIPLTIFPNRIETYLAAALYFLMYFFYAFLYPGLSPVDSFLPEPKKRGKEFFKEKFPYLLRPDFYFLVFAIPICFLFLYCDWVWEGVPEILLMAQFPYRFWGITMFFIVLLLLYVLAPWKNSKAIMGIFFAGVVMFYPSDRVIMDKRIYNYSTGSSISYDPSDWFYENFTQWGTSNEYLPQELIEYHEPTYENSLYSAVRSYFVYKKEMPLGIEDYITPVYLEGEGSVEISYLNTPEVGFRVSVSAVNEDGYALIQIPQIYYDGYKAEATYEDRSTESFEIANVDGLVAAYIKEGDYTLYFSYPGPTSQRVGKVFFIVCGIGAIGFAGYGIYHHHSLRKKEDPIPDENGNDDGQKP
ncbi:MAG: hypothetical protein Q4F15_05240 [Bacillota bacterium]|nr:hypothetical protein [Bacillota bacterium]